MNEKKSKLIANDLEEVKSTNELIKRQVYSAPSVEVMYVNLVTKFGSTPCGDCGLNSS